MASSLTNSTLLCSSREGENDQPKFVRCFNSEYAERLLFTRVELFCLSSLLPPYLTSAYIHVGSTHFDFLNGCYFVPAPCWPCCWFFVRSHSPLFQKFDWLLEEGRRLQPHASCFLLCPATIQPPPPPRPFLISTFSTKGLSLTKLCSFAEEYPGRKKQKTKKKP